MNEIERMNHTQEQIAKAINDSKLPLSTVYMILADFQRQIGDVIVQAGANQPEEKEGVENDAEQVHENRMEE